MYVVFDFAISHMNTQCLEKRCSSPLLRAQTIAPCEFLLRGSSSTTKVTAS